MGFVCVAGSQSAVDRLSSLQWKTNSSKLGQDLVSQVFLYSSSAFPESSHVLLGMADCSRSQSNSPFCDWSLLHHHSSSPSSCRTICMAMWWPSFWNYLNFKRKPGQNTLCFLFFSSCRVIFISDQFPNPYFSCRTEVVETMRRWQGVEIQGLVQLETEPDQTDLPCAPLWVMRTSKWVLAARHVCGLVFVSKETVCVFSIWSLIRKCWSLLDIKALPWPASSQAGSGFAGKKRWCGDWKMLDSLHFRSVTASPASSKISVWFSLVNCRLSVCWFRKGTGHYSGWNIGCIWWSNRWCFGSYWGPLKGALIKPLQYKDSDTGKRSSGF